MQNPAGCSATTKALNGGHLPDKKHARSRERGHAVVEVALMAPWIFFLFVGVLDFGFYSYAAICTQNAARVAALDVSGSEVPTDPALAVAARADVCAEMGSLPNVGSACPSSVVQVVVTPQPYNGVDGDPAGQVSVTYTTIPLIPIPGVLTGQMTITRVVQMRS
jgi:Flp pilus assembly protein TadG